MTHECQFAELIGQKVSYQKNNETGEEVCRWCHEPRYEKVTATKQRVTTNRKKEVA